MDGQQLRQVVDTLAMPDGEYIIFGGGCLAIRGLRPTPDLDLYVTQRLYDQLKAMYGGEVRQHNQTYLIFSAAGTEIEAHATWNMQDWQPDFPRYLKSPEIVRGLPFMPLQDVYEWKKAVRRPKDVSDLELIESYWASASAGELDE